MQDLQLIGVHEDGEHLLLTGPEGERFQMPVDEALRAALRHDRPRLGQLQIEIDGGLRPRDVQALIRAGASADEAASRAGWTVEKVHRYEGPILAEREHVAGLAQKARLRSRTSVSSDGGAPTLASRVTERLKARDVEVTDAGWDSWRTEGRPWTVVLTFAAGGRQRQASWTYDLADRTVSAVDDEARWLSEEVQETKGPIPAPRPRHPSGRQTKVYDVEAEGGLHPTEGAETQDDPLDLMTAMRRRSTARGRRKPGTRAAAGGHKPATSVAEVEEHSAEQARLTDDPEHDLTVLAPQAGTHTSPNPSHVAADHGHTDHGHTDHGHADHNQHHGPEDEQSTAPTARGQEGSGTGDSAPHEKSPHGKSHHEKAAHEKAPRHSSPDLEDEAQEPDENRARQDQSKTRPKRPARESARKAGRPSVPAWDEIMFGAKSGVDRS